MFHVHLRTLGAGVFACALFAGASLAQDQITGRVVRVVDGDTFVVLDHNQRQHRVRLADVDAPEASGQPFNQASRRSLEALVAGKTVTIQIMDTDRFGRPVGRVVLNGRSVSQEQVRAGMAWSARRWNRDPAMPTIERLARASRAGLWAQADPIPPWEWRASKK